MMRVIALCLLLLAASPFTAPFSTFDLGPIGSTAPMPDAAKAKHAHDDVVAVPVFVLLARFAQALDRSPASADAPERRYEGHRTILRL